MDVLTPHQRQVADRVLAEEGARRRHLVVSLSGAHAYGFPSPDSDLDLKAVHADPTVRLLGLAAPTSHASRCEVIEGVEIDYSSNEIGRVLAALLAGNGNYFERFLGAIALVAAPEIEELRPIVRRSLSKRIQGHYSGFARGQLHEWEQNGFRSAKKLLYVLRTALTGTHVLHSGEIVTDVSLLLDEYGFGAARELSRRRRKGSGPSYQRTSQRDGRPSLGEPSSCSRPRWLRRGCPRRPPIGTSWKRGLSISVAEVSDWWIHQGTRDELAGGRSTRPAAPRVLRLASGSRRPSMGQSSRASRTDTGTWRGIARGFQARGRAG